MLFCPVTTLRALEKRDIVQAVAKLVLVAVPRVFGESFGDGRSTLLAHRGIGNGFHHSCRFRLNLLGFRRAAPFSASSQWDIPAAIYLKRTGYLEIGG